MSKYPAVDPALLQAVGIRLGEQRDATAALSDILRKTLAALLIADVEDRTRLVRAALDDLDADRPAPQRTTSEVLQLSEEAGYHARRHD